MSSYKRRGEISITFMSGPLDGKTLTFEQPEPGKQRIITIGRREGCDVLMKFDNQVSRLHARLGCTARAVTASDSMTSPMLLNFWLEDGGSRNGTFVEKETDPLEGRVQLRPGTLFRVGRTWLRLDVPLSYG
ncbi:MAG: FHA domain-containing protein [Anaerolineae bacterium]|jgi:pSer/pThr/pTyr-binding forkhead associated (FHA) protein|nr:FHA domain-containing protein [Anaerolineae bacterium]